MLSACDVGKPKGLALHMTDVAVLKFSFNSFVASLELLTSSLLPNPTLCLCSKRVQRYKYCKVGILSLVICQPG